MSYQSCRGRVPTSGLGSWDLSRTPNARAERRSRRLARCRSGPRGADIAMSENSLRTLLGTLQSGPAHAAWEDRELGLVAVGVGTGVAYADVEHH